MDAEGWNRRYAASPGMWGAEPNVFLADAASGLKPGRALDLACGDGRNTLWLAASGWTVTAVDFSSVAIDRARDAARRAGAEVDLQVQDVTEWVPAEAAYDLVALVYLQLPHERLRDVVRHACRAVAPGGTLFMVGHHLDNLEHGVGGPQTAEVLYTEGDLADWCDLEVLSARKAERAVETEVGLAVALDAVLVARR